MDLKFLILSTCLLLCPPTATPSPAKSHRHFPPAYVPTFLRDSVEHVPQELFRKAADYVSAAAARTFGSQRLPLRSAVESAPQIEQSRLPLRDAVERRLVPEYLHLEYDVDIDLLDPNLDLYRTWVPDKTPFSPYVRFQNLLGVPPPYRVDNPYQRLVDISQVPGVGARRGRNLGASARFAYANKNLGEKYLSSPNVRLSDLTSKARVICYIQQEAVYRKEPLAFSVQDLDPFACSHVLYAFASIDPHSYNIIPRDHEYDVVKGGYRSATGLKQFNPNLKLLISIGGDITESSRKFSNMVATPSRRRDFIRSLILFLQEFDFDGIDLHWMYPGSEELGGATSDRENFAALLVELKEILKPRGYILSIAVPGSRFRAEDGYDMGVIAGVVDFVNLQAFDMHLERNNKHADHHAPISRRDKDKTSIDTFLNVDYAVRYWLKKGMPRYKINLGVPFYGRSFTLRLSENTKLGADIKGLGEPGFYTQTPGLLAYFEVCDKIINEGWETERDDVGSPYAFQGDQWVSFDDVNSIENKMRYAREIGLGGAAVWTLDLDDFRGLCGDKYPLLTTIRASLSANLPHSLPLITTPQLLTGRCDKEGLYSDPKDCSAYYVCRSGHSFRVKCKSAFLFNAELGKCEMMSADMCRPGVTKYIGGKSEVIDTSITTSQLLMGLCDKEGLYSDPKDCSAYYVCRSGHSYRVKCKPEFLFNAELGKCDTMSAEMCRPGISVYVGGKSEVIDTTITTSQLLMGLCDKEGLYSDPKDCSAYYICRSGHSYRVKCKPTFLFNAEIGKCDSMSADLCRPGVSKYFGARSELVETRARLDEKKVVCYVTNWAFYRKGVGKFVPEHLDHRLCTHIVWAFASLEPEMLMIKEFDPWADIDNNLYERITTTPDSKVLLALGGWTDSNGDKFSRLVSDGSARRRFVLSAVSFLRRHNFRGLHLDWNYPVCWQSNCQKGPKADKPNFTKLLQELKAEFDKQTPRLILAAAISGYKEVIDVAYELDKIGEVLEFMSVMTYDYHGAWERKTGHVSPLYHRQGDKYMQYNSNYTMEYLVQKGAPRSKLLLGIPFYGQSYTLPNTQGARDHGVPATGPGEPGEFTRQPGMLAYYEICNRVKAQRWAVKQDPLRAAGPYAHSRDQWVGYEDADSVAEKAQYVRSGGFGGAVAWTVDLDDFNNRCCQERFPLLKSLNRALGRLKDTAPQTTDCTKPPEPITPPAPTLTTGVDTGAISSPTPPTSWPQWSSPSTTTSTTSTTSKTPAATSPSKPVTWWSTTSTEMTPTQTWWTTRRTTLSTTVKPTTTERVVSTTEKVEATTIPTPAVVMPASDPAPGPSCEAGVYLPDPQNCNAYYRCVLGELRRQYCAGGLHWNKERLVCDWPTTAKCEEKASISTNPTNQPQTPQTPLKPTSKPSASPTTGRPMADEAACISGQYYGHEFCDHFYVCVNGVKVTQRCGPGLHWNTEKGSCDWAFKVDCEKQKAMMRKKPVRFFTQSSNVILKAEPYSPCEDGTFASYPTDCTMYLQCLWGKYETYHCAPGLHWNANQKTCDWPAIAKCSIKQSDVENTIFAETTTSNWLPPITKPTQTTIATPGTTTESPEPINGYFKIVCYFTNWAWYRKGVGKYTPEHIDPNLCTHIVYGFAVLDYENLIVKAHDSWADFDNKFYERVVAYKTKGLKVSLALGGWNDSAGDKYSRLVNNPSARTRFINHVIDFLDKYHFDGLDLDWEYPKCWQVDCSKGPASDKAAFAAFTSELRAAFKPRGLLLSAAVTPSKTVIDAGYDVQAIARNLDWVAVMTYDFHGQWDKQTGHVAPMYLHEEDSVAYFNANYSINYWISEGVPRRKIIMGMPLYGQSFQLEREEINGLNAKAPGPGQAGEYTRAAGFLAYYEICDRVQNQGWTVVQDEGKRMGPYAYKGNQWVSYDDPDMIRLKSEYIRDMDLGGGMIWALDLDDFRNRCGQGAHPLLSVIRDVLREAGPGFVVQPVVQMEEVKPEEKPSTKKPDVKPVVMKPDVKPEMPLVKPGDVKPEMPLVETSTVTSVVTSEYKVVCYFTNWAWYRQGGGKYLPSHIDPDLCTHIVYGFAVLNGDQLIIKPHDTWADFDNKFYEKVTDLRAKGIKVLIALGGWNDSAGDKYSRLVNNPSARRKFIAHVVDFIQNNNFDGLDLDWEYPKCWQVDCNKGPESDKAAFAEFVKELRVAFDSHNWLLSAAVSPSKRVVDAGYDVPALSKYLDWIAVMCYDYHGQWDKITGHVAPMYAHDEDADVTFNTNYTIHYWIEKGADRRKLVLGMPMYGQSFSLADNMQNGLNAPTYGGGEAGEATRARGFLSYYEICANIRNKGWTVIRDPKGRMGPYAYLRDQWVSFDDQSMIQHKAEYVKAMGLGGGMIWALDLDDFKNDCGCEEYPLLRTINRVLRDYKTPQPDCILEPKYKKIPPKKPITPSVRKPCAGRLFLAHEADCNKYYLCNQGELMEQRCPAGLHWNDNRCDWPQTSGCTIPETTTVYVPTTQGTVENDVMIEQEITVKPVYDGTGYKVICYFTNWAWYRQGDGKYLPSDIDETLCTHINYGFAVLDGSTLTIKPHDSWADIDNEFYKKVTALRAKGIKVLVAIGGWNDSLGDKYSRLVNNPSAREKFISNVMQFIAKYNFDGLDLDWEYPKCWQVDCNKGPASDKEGFTALVRELSVAFKPKGLLLSAAVSPSKAVIDAGYEVAQLSKYFDWIAVMTYDFHGHWDKRTGHVAPLYYLPGDTYDYFNANFSLNYWIEQGADPQKIIMGMPLYGQSFSLADASNKEFNSPSYGPGEAGEFTRAGGFLAFYEICDRIKNRGWTTVRDDKGRVGPYAYSGNQWVSYDDVSEIVRKSKLVKELNLGGGMIWALDLDDFRNRCGCGKHPLLKAMNHELRGIKIDTKLTDCT